MFCAKALPTLIQKNVERGVLYGVRICRNALVISNLFFADDTIIFGRAKSTELRCVKQILEDYAAASGQAINLSKSKIMFSGGMSEARGEKLVGLLGIIKVDQHAIYLGIPTSAGCSRSAIFKTLVARVEEIEGLKEQNFVSSRKTSFDQIGCTVHPDVLNELLQDSPGCA